MDIRELINFAKGNRKMTDFAQDIGVSYTTLYRIANGDIRRMPSDKTINAIVDGKDAGVDLTMEMIKDACQKVLHKKPEANTVFKDNTDSVKKASLIIGSELLQLGHTMKKSEPKDSYFDFCYELNDVYSFVYSVFDDDASILLEYIYSCIGKWSFDYEKYVNAQHMPWFHIIVMEDAASAEAVNIILTDLYDAKLPIPVSIIIMEDDRILGEYWLTDKTKPLF